MNSIGETEVLFTGVCHLGAEEHVTVNSLGRIAMLFTGVSHQNS